ncbi:hypothetical protein L7F22_058246 [Adiantum nelumboides]|nr:hypothetical protein [Adiantum nelumboides]
MISRLIRSKPSVPHDIIRAELAAPPMLVEALFQTICMLHRLQSMDRDRLAYRAFSASQYMALAGDRSSWYAQTRDWFSSQGLDIDRLPPLQYDTQGLDIDRLPPLQYDTQASTYSLTRSMRNRVIRQKIWHTYIQRTWVDPGHELPSKMLHYREHFLPLSEEGFIETPLYMQRYMPHHIRVVIGQLKSVLTPAGD